MLLAELQEGKTYAFYKEGDFSFFGDFSLSHKIVKVINWVPGYYKNMLFYRDLKFMKLSNLM